MKVTHTLSIAAAMLVLPLVTACSKPAPPADTASVAVADAKAAPAETAGGVTDAGGAVSPPQANGAVNTDANTTSSEVAPGSNSFTEGEARGHIEHAGYANVTGLTKTPDGLWTGKATKAGKTVDVAVDFKGAVTAK